MCDGLADQVLPLLKEMVEYSCFLRRVEEPKIVIYVQGYAKTKQRDSWFQHAIKACNKVFECFGHRVKLLDLDDASSMGLLQHCNIFHMAGGNAWRLVQDWHHHPHHLEVLKDRVQRGEVLYIGSSGGAISAGQDMRHCEDDRAGMGDVGDRAAGLDMNGLGIIELNVGVHHSNHHKFNNADDAAVFLGPQTAIFSNGMQLEPAMAATVKPCVKESLLASPYIVAKLLHRPQQPIPTSSASSCENPVTNTPMTLQMVLQQGGYFFWNGSSDQRFHVQTQNVASSSGSPLVVIWLSGSGGHDELTVGGGPTATAIHDSAILVSPQSSLKHRADVPDWIVKLTAALTQEVGGRLVLVGFSRGAKWCHEILRQLITMSASMPLRCLLVAPYCAARFNVHEQRDHALSIKRGLTTVRSICTMQDTSCPWEKYGDLIVQMGTWRDVSTEFPTHEDTLSGFLRPESSDVALDVQWLLGTVIKSEVEFSC
jgi:peptidase E